MKKLLVVATLIFSVLVGCGESQAPVQEKLPEGVTAGENTGDAKPSGTALDIQPRSK